MLGFHEDALLLSGPAGSRLKTRILGDYYEFWWKITSGGPAKQYGRPTSFVDLNAGTGELYIEETKETILGSAGHALSVKYDSGLPTDALTLVFVEEDAACFNHQQNVIRRRWPQVPLDQAIGPVERNRCGVHLLSLDLQGALDAIQRIRLGNSVFFFDPLLHVEWETIERVARRRIARFYQTGTEFIIFLFTSDWFTGRHYGSGQDLVPLPISIRDDTWNAEECVTVAAADGLLGDRDWRDRILVDLDRQTRQDAFVEEYQKRLMKWFRWVLPLPFVPKQGQVYHLFFCSNYEDGIRVTRDLYCRYTRNPRYEPDNERAYQVFSRVHPELLIGLKQSQRPLPWKVLWHVIRHCEGGVCDPFCVGIQDKGSPTEVLGAMSWLQERGYLTPLTGIPTAWPGAAQRFVLNWDLVRASLSVGRPSRLRPITPEEIEALASG